MKLPNKHMKWTSEWTINREAEGKDHDGTYDKDGWQYALNWSNRFSGKQALSDFIRRRRWIRVCEIKQDSASKDLKKQKFD